MGRKRKARSCETNATKSQAGKATRSADYVDKNAGNVNRRRGQTYVRKHAANVENAWPRRNCAGCGKPQEEPPRKRVRPSTSQRSLRSTSTKRSSSRSSSASSDEETSHSSEVTKAQVALPCRDTEENDEIVGTKSKEAVRATEEVAVVVEPLLVVDSSQNEETDVEMVQDTDVSREGMDAALDDTLNQTSGSMEVRTEEPNECSTFPGYPVSSCGRTDSEPNFLLIDLTLDEDDCLMKGDDSGNHTDVTDTDVLLSNYAISRSEQAKEFVQKTQMNDDPEYVSIPSNSKNFLNNFEEEERRQLNTSTTSIENVRNSEREYEKNYEYSRPSTSRMSTDLTRRSSGTFEEEDNSLLKGNLQDNFPVTTNKPFQKNIAERSDSVKDDPKLYRGSATNYSKFSFKNTTQYNIPRTSNSCEVASHRISEEWERPKERIHEKVVYRMETSLDKSDVPTRALSNKKEVNLPRENGRIYEGVDYRRPLPGNDPGPSRNVEVVYDEPSADAGGSSKSEDYTQLLKTAESMLDWSYGEDSQPPSVDALKFLTNACEISAPACPRPATPESLSSEGSFHTARSGIDVYDSAPDDQMMEETRTSSVFLVQRERDGDDHCTGVSREVHPKKLLQNINALRSSARDDDRRLAARLRAAERERRAEQRARQRARERAEREWRLRMRRGPLPALPFGPYGPLPLYALQQPPPPPPPPASVDRHAVASRRRRRLVTFSPWVLEADDGDVDEGDADEDAADARR